MTKEREAKSDVELSEEMSHAGELRPGGDFHEVHAQLFMGESQGYDICLVPNAWHVGGGKKGKWRVDDAMICQTTFIIVPKDYRGKMHDNDFISNRQDATEWQDDVRIEEKGESVIWHAGNRQYISRPPYWEVKGEHMGVDCDLILGGLGNTTRTFGAWSDLNKNGKAGYDHRCWAEGTITVGGKKHTLEKGFGIHELMAFGNSWDQMVIMRNPYYWIVSMNESMQIYLVNVPGLGFSYGRVYLDDKEIPFGKGEVTIDELELWIDPKTGMQAPIRWHLNMNSAHGVLDMEMTAYARGLYCVMTSGGYTMRNCFMIRSNGRFFLPTGQSVPIQDMMTYMEWGRSAMPLEGGTT